MRDAQEVLTQPGYLAYQTHLVNIDNAIFYILNHADDLALSETHQDNLQLAAQTVKYLLENINGDDEEDND
jgi:hypothetical protein